MIVITNYNVPTVELVISAINLQICQMTASMNTNAYLQLAERNRNFYKRITYLLKKAVSVSVSLGRCQLLRKET